LKKYVQLGKTPLGRTDNTIHHQLKEIQCNRNGAQIWLLSPEIAECGSKSLQVVARMTEYESSEDSQIANNFYFFPPLRQPLECEKLNDKNPRA
jgi:hypothetical protein